MNKPDLFFLAFCVELSDAPSLKWKGNFVVACALSVSELDCLAEHLLPVPMPRVNDPEVAHRMNQARSEALATAGSDPHMVALLNLSERLCFLARSELARQSMGFVGYEIEQGPVTEFGVCSRIKVGTSNFEVDFAPDAWIRQCDWMHDFGEILCTELSAQLLSECSLSPHLTCQWVARSFGDSPDAFATDAPGQTGLLSACYELVTYRFLADNASHQAVLTVLGAERALREAEQIKRSVAPESGLISAKVNRAL